LQLISLTLIGKGFFSILLKYKTIINRKIGGRGRRILSLRPVQVKAATLCLKKQNINKRVGSGA
jgi:hypothetical protein